MVYFKSSAAYQSQTLCFFVLTMKRPSLSFEKKPFVIVLFILV